MLDLSKLVSDPNHGGPRAWQLIFIGSTFAETQEIRDVLWDIYPDWLYNWQPDGISALDYMMTHGLPDIALINANIKGMSAPEVVEWIQASPSPRYILTVIYDVASDTDSSQNSRADAVVDNTNLGRRDLIKVTDRMIRCVRLDQLPSRKVQP